jgi:Macrocin-O-methyltransferase (TylF)
VHPGPVSLLNVDCDLYSSTRTILRYLGHKIVPGTIILFDEYLNYPGWWQHEFKAFQEYIAWSGQTYEYISIIGVHQQAGVRITG